MSQHDRVCFIVTCPDCVIHKEIEDVNDAIVYYRRHYSLTGHDLVWDRADFDSSAVSSNEPLAIIAELEAQLASSAPIGLITVAMSKQGTTIGETLEQIHDLRMAGKLYEPRNDHLRVT
jgi:hypothetical protein